MEIPHERICRRPSTFMLLESIYEILCILRVESIFWRREWRALLAVQFTVGYDAVAMVGKS